MPATVSRISTLLRFAAMLSILTFALTPDARPAPPQDPPMEWGEIPASDLAMTSYPGDSTAPAVVLCDYGETILSNSLELVFTRHARIKIFEEAGFKWANQAVVFWSHKHYETIRDIEGYTYALDAGGKVVRTEMESDAVFREPVNEYWSRCRFALPALRPGCIVEFRYTIRSRPWNAIRDWQFQHRIPVRWSEYRVMMPHQIAYAAVSNKRFPFAVDEMKETMHVYTGDAGLYVGRDAAKCYRYRWVVRDAPALRDEPMVSNIDDYAQQMDLELSEYANWHTVGSELIARTWDDAIARLLKQEDFGDRIELTSGVRALSARLTAGFSSPADRMRALYDYVRTSIVWSRWEGLYSPLGPDEVIAARKGSVSQIAFLMVSLLRAAGIEADPVVLSTRSHGMIQIKFPVMSQFNFVIACARIGDQEYFLDATDPLRPLEILSPDLQRVGGLVIKPGTAEWVKVNSPGIYGRRTAVRFALREDGGIEGTVDRADEQYATLEGRNRLAKTKPLEFAKEALEGEGSGIVVDSVNLDGKDDFARPLHFTAKISAGAYAQASGDLLYCNPAVVDRWAVNPFKSETRTYPVNMTYPRRYTTTVTIVLPKGCELKELPGDQIVRCGGNDAIATRVGQRDGSTVQFVTNIFINRTEFPPSSYAELRQFYEHLAAMQSERMVIQRTPPPPAVEAKKPRH